MHFPQAASVVLVCSVICSSWCGTISADELTEARIRTLPAEEQPAWLAYWQTSQAMAKKDQTTLEAEVAANGLTAAIKAKSTEVLWARFYDPNSLRPVFSGRDGVIYESFEEMSQKNEIGYDYYSSLPGSVLKTGQKKWRKMLTTKE